MSVAFSTATLVSIGTTGVPGVGMVMLAIVSCVVAKSEGKLDLDVYRRGLAASRRPETDSSLGVFASVA